MTLENETEILDFNTLLRGYPKEANPKLWWAAFFYLPHSATRRI
jgi:hypothetical protein